ncbi:hypothetical protein L1887_03604 [Cichorium endivia]|nr:hypothetical protein L1887_03604 [Cichorium endivia]
MWTYGRQSLTWRTFKGKYVNSYPCNWIVQVPFGHEYTVAGIATVQTITLRLKKPIRTPTPYLTTQFIFPFGFRNCISFINKAYWKSATELQFQQSLSIPFLFSKSLIFVFSAPKLKFWGNQRLQRSNQSVFVHLCFCN